MTDAERLRVYLQGWDDAMRCYDETMSWVPDEHLVGVIRRRRNELAERALTTPENVEPTVCEHHWEVHHWLSVDENNDVYRCKHCGLTQSYGTQPENVEEP